MPRESDYVVSRKKSCGPVFGLKFAGVLEIVTTVFWLGMLMFDFTLNTDGMLFHMIVVMGTGIFCDVLCVTYLFTGIRKEDPTLLCPYIFLKGLKLISLICACFLSLILTVSRTEDMGGPGILFILSFLFGSANLIAEALSLFLAIRGWKYLMNPEPIVDPVHSIQNSPRPDEEDQPQLGVLQDNGGEFVPF